MPNLFYDHTPTPLGALFVAWDEEGRLVRVSWDVDEAALRAQGVLERSADTFGNLAALEAYVAGELNALVGLAVAPAGTPFQQKVWRSLRDIPAGATTSYGEGLHRKRWLLDHGLQHCPEGTFPAVQRRLF